MSLVGNIRGGLMTGRKAVTVAGFSLLGAGSRGPGEQYLENGCYGIYKSAYNNGGYGYDRALQLSAVFACIKIIAEDIASLPCFVNERAANGVRLASSHSVYRLLHDSPNPDMTAMQLREALISHALLCGAGYARIERSRSDSERLIALWPWMPYEVRKDRDLKNNVVFIHGNKTYQQRDVFQLHGFSTTGNEGLNVLALARNVIGLGMAQEEYAARFFSQDQTPPILLKHPSVLGPEGVAGVKKAWKDHHQGPDRWHTPGVVQEGMDVIQLKPNARDSQLKEQREFQLLEVCRLFRMRPHKLADLGRATWANISAENVSHYNETLRPWLVRFEQGANKWLLQDSDRYYVEHEIAGFLRGDFQMQTEGFRTLLASGVYSINEVRGYMNLNPIEGGDNHFIQINQGTVQSVAEGVAQQVDSSQLQPVGGAV